jgi:branched-subunit amino acid aminotransferase/4-amino-4-deoxychorismate lyase
VSAGCICVNGRFGDPGEASVSALDAGFLLGDGLFESMRVSGCRPYLLERHLARLVTSAGLLGFERVPDSAALAAQVLATVERADLAEAYLRITVTRGVAPAPLGGHNGDPTVVVAALPLPDQLTTAGEVSVISVQLPGPPQAPVVKSTSRQSSVLARRSVERAGAAEGIYVTPGGLVLEALGANVFVIEGDRLSTPPTDQCLAGVTRGRVLELASQAGIATSEEQLELTRVLAADHVFLTNAVRGLRAVARIDGTRVGGSASDPAFAAVRDLYERDRRGGYSG